MNIFKKVFSQGENDYIRSEPELLKTVEHDVNQLLQWVRGCLTQGHGLIAQSELDHLNNIQSKIRLLIEEYEEYFEEEKDDLSYN